MREFAWTVAGASVGGLVRCWVHQLSSDRGLAPTLLLATVAAVLTGFGFAASIHARMRAVLLGAGGAAGSISAVATQAASATPVQSLIGLAASFLCAVTGLLLGVLVASAVPRNTQRTERR